MPNSLMAEYSAQRSSAGLLIAEVSAAGSRGFRAQRGIENDGREGEAPAEPHSCRHGAATAYRDAASQAVLC